MNLSELKAEYDFFSSIPDNEWITNDYDDGHGKCAVGHRSSNDHSRIDYEGIISDCYKELYGSAGSLPDINDGNDERYRQDTPKERVLTFFSDLIKSKEVVEEVSNIINVKEEEYATV